MYPPSPCIMSTNSERHGQLCLRPIFSKLSIHSKDTSASVRHGMIHISPRSVVLKQDEQEHLLFIPAATPVFEDVQIHARVSLFRNNDNNNNTSYGIRRTDPFPELAETFWNEIIDYDSKNDRYVDCQESTIRRDIDRVIEVKDDDGCVPESLLFPID